MDCKRGRHNNTLNEEVITASSHRIVLECQAVATDRARRAKGVHNTRFDFTSGIHSCHKNP